MGHEGSGPFPQKQASARADAHSRAPETVAAARKRAARQRIQWKCDENSARQLARPYIDRALAGDIEQSRIVKVARRPGRADTTYVVHPKVFAAVKAETRAPHDR